VDLISSWYGGSLADCMKMTSSELYRFIEAFWLGRLSGDTNDIMHRNVVRGLFFYANIYCLHFFTLILPLTCLKLECYKDVM